METTIELKYGFTDKNGKTHRDVTIGKRPTFGDLVLLDSNPLANANLVHKEQLIRRLMITKFGDLKCPLSPHVLPTLDTVDDDALANAANTFMAESRGDREAEYLEHDTVRLIFGIEIDEVVYDTVKFGKRLTVADKIEAERRSPGGGLVAEAYRVCRQISELSSSESGLKIEGPIDSDKLVKMDGEDFNVLRFAAEFFRNEIGKPADAEREDGPDNSDGSKADRLVGSGNNGDAAGEVK